MIASHGYTLQSYIHQCSGTRQDKYVHKKWAQSSKRKHRRRLYFFYRLRIIVAESYDVGLDSLTQCEVIVNNQYPVYLLLVISAGG